MVNSLKSLNFLLVESRENVARAKALYTHNRFLGELDMMYSGKGGGKESSQLHFYHLFFIYLFYFSNNFYLFLVKNSIAYFYQLTKIIKKIPCIWKRMCVSQTNYPLSFMIFEMVYFLSPKLYAICKLYKTTNKYITKHFEF